MEHDSSLTTDDAHAAAEPVAAGRRAWIALAVLAFPTLLVSMDMTILYLATPALSAALQPSATQLLWISDIYGFILAGALIPMGALGDRFGRRGLLLAGAVSFSLASLLAACAWDVRTLIGARALMGVAGATLLPSTLAMIRGLFHRPAERSLAIGLWTTCFTLGAVLGPLIGGLLLERFWWGSVFLLAIPLVLPLLLLGRSHLPEVREPATHAIDALSVVLSIGAVLTITLAVKSAAAHGMSGDAITTALLGLLLGGAFVHRQRQLASPLLDLRLFSNAAFAAAISANSMALFAWVGASFLVAQYMQWVLGFSPLAAGLWTLPSAFACVAACLGAPVLAQRFPSAWLVFLGLACTVLGLGVLAALTRHWGLPAAVVGMVLLGLGVSVIVTLSTGVVLSTSPVEKAGAASAISETGADLGGSFGVAVLGSIGAAVYHRHLVLPAELASEPAGAARETLGAALNAAARLAAPQGEATANAAREAFLAGFQAAHIAAGLLLAVAAAAFARTTIRSAGATRPMRK